MKKRLIYLALIDKEFNKVATQLNSIDNSKTISEHKEVLLSNARSFVGGIISHPILSPTDRPPLSPIAHLPLIPNPPYITYFPPTGIHPVILPRKRPGM